MNLEHVHWSRNMFDSIAEGGTWGLPSCGLVFSKRAGKLILIAQMPHDPAMPITARELLAQQQAMFDNCKAHFEAAGIPVIRSTTAPIIDDAVPS